MENRRLILFMVLAFSLFMLWQGWLKQNQPAPVAGTPATQGQPLAVTPTPSTALTAAPGGNTVGDGGAVSSKSGPRMTVRTDTVVAEISAQGGDIVRLELLTHKASGEDNANFLIFDNGEHHIYLAQSGLIGANMPT